MSDVQIAAGSFITKNARISTNGIELAYTECGRGEPLVLIMGLGADRHAWELHLAAFAGAYRCFAGDNRGSGESSAPDGPYSTAQMADDYAGLIRSLDLGAVRVVGISMGGAIAQQLAIRHPELVSKIVIVSSWGRVDDYARAVFEQLRVARGTLAPADFARMLQLLIWAPKSYDEKADELVASRSAEPTVAARGFVAQADACIGHDVIDALGSISVPTLVTVGSRDVFTPVELSQQLADLIPGSELKTYDGLGHAHHWEQLERFNSDVLEWLE
ncbi:MAG: hydrolase [Glaciihabitans sp.]|jgi:pimeloyl-ACP methyl ester carboxylesterase|nr:hydrolase [Glaciihabitans sp.]